MNTKRTLLKTVAAAAFASIAMGSALAADITGAGATFPFPIYAKWAEAYKKETGTGLNYQSIGSSGGIKQIRAKTVTFGATDAPVPGADLDKDGMVQFPAIIGGTVPVINLDGFKPGELRVTGPVLADMFLGNITKWNDAKLAALNPGKALPDQNITIVHRADGSGTTWIFTNYLDKVSPSWHQKIGTGKTVAWPGGVGAKGNPGVAAYVQRVDYSIGYVEYAYAVQNDLLWVTLQNRAGKYVSPSVESFQAAAKHADWANAAAFYLVLTDQPGDDTWPIVGASFVLIQKEQTSAETARTMLSFFDWCYRFGGDMARERDYVPLPMNVVDLVEAAWKSDVRAAGKPVWK